ncbi:helix-turn-helix domain-containing protein [Aristophania vespae]|uniref:Helix-turn-helix domain-containing protein n=1 Tax=Aristophania vespae TaxID=2697033 RepID=A0A6P1NEY9_9PROT|nr:helix-turn-helix domain-containing protein [Aristophania vespae]QHI95130.1 helix-turn-helix domain-containing protein [Aristophania vespae]UMM64340.1 hypothetical protein DM15PD_13530 [Aristophania vespae]
MSSNYVHPDFSEITILTVLKALADPIRLDLVRQLHKLGKANCTTLLGKRPKSSMSHHFQVLRDSGIIHTQIKGVQHINAIRRQELDEHFPGLMEAVIKGLLRD